MAQPSSALLPSTRAARDATCLTPGHDKTFCTPQVHLVDQPQRPGSQSELNRLHRPTQSPRAVPLAPHPHASALQVVDPRPMYSGTSAAYRGSDRWAFWDPPLPPNQQQTTLPPSSPNEKRACLTIRNCHVQVPSVDVLLGAGEHGRAEALLRVRAADFALHRCIEHLWPSTCHAPLPTVTASAAPTQL